MVVIPSRYASTRFPGKPLARLGGKPIVQWVWERSVGVEGVNRVVVATDDERIAEAVAAFGGEAMMTSERHRSGTDRCGEVLQRLEAEGERFDVVVNVQGDEPFVEASQLQCLMGAFDSPEVDIATLCTPIRSEEELLSENNVKVVMDVRGKALYFSRQPIPYQRGVAQSEWLLREVYNKHVGVYAFRSQVLAEVCRLVEGTLEQCEKLEQLRWLEAGYDIYVRPTKQSNVGIDTPADLVEAERLLAQWYNERKIDKI